MPDTALAAGQSLLGVLRRTLAPEAVDLEVSTFGGVVRVTSVAKAIRRSCKTNCSLYINQSNPHTPGFQTYFEEGGEQVAWGMSDSESEAVTAIQHWLQGSTIELLYENCQFVDQYKRRLAKIRQDVVETAPSLASETKVELREFGIQSALWFRGESRAVMVDGTSLNSFFKWDEANLFQWVVNDSRVFALMVSKWIFERRAPSAMKMDFPLISMGRLAEFYENGNPIEGDFLSSWDDAERWLRYFQSVSPQRAVALPLLEAFRTARYDTKLRIGTDHGRLKISRSRREGLNPGQPYIEFSFADQSELMNVFTNIEGVGELRGIEIALSKEVSAAVEKLLEFPVTETSS